METILKHIKIARLLCKRRLIGLDKEEEEMLDSWRREDLRNEKEYSLYQHVDTDNLASRYERIDTDKQWSDFRRRVAGKKRRIWLRVGGVAAGLCLIIGISYLLYTHSETPYPPQSQEAVSQNIRLILSSGKTLDLSDRKHLDIRQIEGNAVLHDNKLEYRTDTALLQTVESNTLIIPKGAFYHLILADGTKVWLNSDTRIVYPVAFPGEKREVTLAGEAFFEVTKDPQKPFIVKTDNLNVKVLGTSFNINTYSDDGKVYAALQQGVVEVNAGRENTLLLAPGQVAELDIRQPGAVVKLSDVSLTQQIAWKEGLFCFRSTPLPEILRQIERYYDVSFVDQAKASDEVYSGDISRNVSLEEILQAISAQTTNIEFKSVDKVVYIMKKRD